MTDGIYACLWIIKEQRALPNHEGVNSPTALAIADAYAAVENWLAQQKKEAKELEEAAYASAIAKAVGLFTPS